MTRTIYINGRFLTQPLTGVQRYCHELLRTWDEMDVPVQFVCLTPGGDHPNPNWKRIKLQVIGRNRGNLWEQWDLPKWLKGRFLFSPSNIGPVLHTNQAVTLHDASIFAVPQAYSWMFKAKYRYVFRQLCRKARLILTDSQFSRKELSHWLMADHYKFQVVQLGSDHLQNCEAREDILDRLDLRGRKFLLSVASHSPHKNISRLIQALKKVSADVLLVQAGGSFERVFQGERQEQGGERVIQTGYLQDEELKALYQHATGFIFPSLYEGFGLPVLEAMSCGCPVLCSRAASLPEVGGEAVLYFDPLSVDEMATTIQRFLADSQLQDDLRQRGKLQAARFSWEKTARQTLDLLLSLVEGEMG